MPCFSVLAVLYYAAFMPKCSNCLDALTGACSPLPWFSFVFREADGNIWPVPVSRCCISACGGAPSCFCITTRAAACYASKAGNPCFGGASHIWVRLLWARNSPATQFSNTFGTEESQPLSCIACPCEQTVEHRQRNAYITIVCQCPYAS